MVPIEERVQRWAAIQDLLQPVPALWITEARESKNKEAQVQLSECKSYSDLVEAWKPALVWTRTMDDALTVMLAVTASTMTEGEQLWFKILSVASSGKTTLLEAISTCREYVVPKDQITKFYTGYKTADGSDASIIVQINGKTLANKEGDTILRAGDRDQILAQARALYDTSGRTHYNNQTGKDYEDIRFTWIICGTPRLRELDDSDLGDRCLDLVMTEEIDEVNEEKIGMRAIDQYIKYRAVHRNGTSETRYTPEMLKAMSMTGGYVKYMRENVNRLLGEVTLEQDSQEKKRLYRLALFIAYLRTRVDESRTPKEVRREMNTRLVKQLVKLAFHIAAVRGESTLSTEVMRIVTKVAMDTSQGKALDLVKYLNKEGENGATPKGIAITLNHADDRTSNLLKHLKRLGVVESAKIGMQMRYRLTEKMRRLYRAIWRGR